MCGIASLSRAAGKSSVPDARHFARAASVAIESRGRHATGFGWHDQNDHPWLWKDQGPATMVAKKAPLPQGMRQVIVHTRHATTGSPSRNENNHPVTAPGIALVHNGRVDNYEALSAASGLPRVAEVDSEALALILSARLRGGIVEALSEVHGVAAIAWLEQDDRSLHLARLSTRPMTIGWTRRGDLVMSSTPGSLDLTAKLTGVAIHRIRPIPEGTYLRVVDGVIVEEARFTVHAPAVRPPEDRPLWGGLEPARRLSPSRERRLDDLGVDWDNVVPRRGWK